MPYFCLNVAHHSSVALKKPSNPNASLEDLVLYAHKRKACILLVSGYTTQAEQHITLYITILSMLFHFKGPAPLFIVSCKFHQTHFWFYLHHEQSVPDAIIIC
jgi:hypothetical protein